MGCHSCDQIQIAHNQHSQDEVLLCACCYCLHGCCGHGSKRFRGGRGRIQRHEWPHVYAWDGHEDGDVPLAVCLRHAKRHLTRLPDRGGWRLLVSSRPRQNVPEKGCPPNCVQRCLSRCHKMHVHFNGHDG